MKRLSWLVLAVVQTAMSISLWRTVIRYTVEFPREYPPEVIAAAHASLPPHLVGRAIQVTVACATWWTLWIWRVWEETREEPQQSARGVVE